MPYKRPCPVLRHYGCGEWPTPGWRGIRIATKKPAKTGGTAMSLELTLLIWAVGLAFVQMLVAASGAILQFGLPDIAGNRETLAPATTCARPSPHSPHTTLETLLLCVV